MPGKSRSRKMLGGDATAARAFDLMHHEDQHRALVQPGGVAKVGGYNVKFQPERRSPEMAAKAVRAIAGAPGAYTTEPGGKIKKRKK